MISHHHKCIFVHIPKNAGQSVEHVFIDQLDLTWDTRAPLLLRSNDKIDLGPPRLAHLKSHEYVKYKYITAEQYESYFKFSFVRNPWARMVSFYKYSGYSTKCSFKDFLKGEFINHIWKEHYWFVCPQSEYLYYNGKLNVNYIGRFENLQNDFNHICEQIGLFPIQLPHINKSSELKSNNNTLKKTAKYLLEYINEPESKNISHDFNLKKIIQKIYPNLQTSKIKNYSNYQDYYDEESKELVTELYKQDIELFGYSFN